MTVAEKIRYHRKQMGLTQKEVSELAHIGLSTIQRLEQGKGLPNEYSLRALAKVFVCDYRDLDDDHPA